MRTYRFKILLVTLLGGLVIFAACLIYRTSRSEVRKLPGGQELSLSEVTYGPTHVSFPGGPVDQWIYRFFPGRQLKLGPLKIIPAPPITNVSTYSDGRIAEPKKAVVWILHEGNRSQPPLSVPEEKWFHDVRASLVDEAGEEWEMRPGSSQFYAGGRKSVLGVSGWRFPAFPRRSKKIFFRLYARDSAGHWDMLAEFPFRNRAFQDHPVWKGANLPCSQTRSNLEVTLIEFISGVKATASFPEQQRPFTTMSFTVKENGQPVTDWQPDRLEATDATGNEGSFQIINYGQTNGVAFCETVATSLSPSEVWRLRVRFRRVERFQPNQIWTSPPLPAKMGRLVSSRVETNFGPYTISVHSERTDLGVRVSPVIKELQLSLLGIEDEQGNAVERDGGMAVENGQMASFLSYLKLKTLTKSVRVRIAFAESRQFEFFASPKAQ